ncbi:hypothetical protein L227DRAFT_36115 [Lentinus tigrinus ALCF2SS1-6]|uniref:Uncharacterized protein n=1 Tax=Lentinus tigrinus ALCF2SS1-6 TaxID=1328759 RepID=A0A5C2SGV2_9APHY|nr:hypothetical protein L227DRAFT_36115 [Lentinus tigrinus ALCF2SS1-6]
MQDTRLARQTDRQTATLLPASVSVSVSVTGCFDRQARVPVGRPGGLGCKVRRPRCCQESLRLADSDSDKLCATLEPQWTLDGDPAGMRTNPRGSRVLGPVSERARGR